MRFQVTTVVLLAAMGGGSLRAAEKAAIDVYMCDRDGSALLLGHGMALASAIFDRIGVRLHWRTGELPAGQNAFGIRTVERAPESATAGALASAHLLSAFGTEITVYGDRCGVFLTIVPVCGRSRLLMFWLTSWRMRCKESPATPNPGS